MLIESYEVQPILHKKLLDVSCGYGLWVGHFAKAYPEMYVEMVDVNEHCHGFSKACRSEWDSERDGSRKQCGDMSIRRIIQRLLVIHRFVPGKKSLHRILAGATT